MTDSHDPAAPEGELPPLSEAEAPEAESPEPERPDDPDPALAFLPVGVRYRHDGWTPDKQVDFIGRLADCGCVEEAARSVGMSRNSAYALRRRDDAQAFRFAWDAAQDAAIVRLNDAALSRAINGV